MPAFDEAFSRSFGLGLSAIQQAQQQKEREEERDWLREQRAQIRSQKAKEDRAWNEYEQVSSRGLSTTGAGLATPDSVGSVVANGYGATVGDAAAKEMSGDYARELGRFAASAPAGLDTSRINAAAAQAAATSQDGPQFRKATGLDINRAKQGVARARRDMGMLDSLETQEAKLGAYARGADVIKDEKALQSYLQRLNLNGDMPLTVADHLNDKGEKTGYKMLHLVDDAGNAAPLKMSMGQIKAAVTGYELMQDPRTFAEGYAMLKDSSKELADRVAAANQRAQAVVTTSNQATTGANEQAVRRTTLEQADRHHRDRMLLEGEGLSLRRRALQLQNDRLTAEDWKLVGVSDDDKGLLYFNPTVGQTQVRPLPPGASAKGLFAKITGNRGAKPLSVDDAMPFIEQLRSDPAHQGKNVFELYRMVQAELGGGGGGRDPMPPVDPPQQGGTKQPTGKPTKPVSDGRTNFGILTSKADLEREVAAGNPHAIRYMDAMRENRINAELGLPGY